MAQHGKVGIRLDSKAKKRLLTCESTGKAPVLGSEAGGRIKIERSADSRCDPRDRNLFGVELAAAIREKFTHSDRDADKCPARRAAALAHFFCRSPRAPGSGQGHIEPSGLRASRPLCEPSPGRVAEPAARGCVPGPAESHQKSLARLVRGSADAVRGGAAEAAAARRRTAGIEHVVNVARDRRFDRLQL